MDSCSKFFGEMFSAPSATLYATTAGSILGYGIVHRLATQYLKGDKNIKQNIVTGFKSTWEPALFLSLPVVAAARCGSWSQLNLSDLTKPLACAFAAISCVSLVNGFMGYNGKLKEVPMNGHLPTAKKHNSGIYAERNYSVARLIALTGLFGYELYARSKLS